MRGGLPAEEDTVLDFTDFVSFRKDLLESLMLDPSATFRLFLGYSGWGPGQLDAEMEQGAWARTPQRVRESVHTATDPGRSVDEGGTEANACFRPTA